MLRLDFYESGIGETILITFPNGEQGIVDACPSTIGSRPSIEELVQGKKLRFACLTHPHKDHGADLLPVLQSKLISEVWHSVDDVSAFLFQTENVVFFKSPLSEICIDILQGWTTFVIELWDAIIKSEAEEIPLNSGCRGFEIAGVKVSVGAPSRSLQKEIREKYVRRCQDKAKTKIDLNDLSIVLLLHYGGRCLILGADALKKAWSEVKRVQHVDGLPKASVLKVPHHGAKNSLHLHSNRAGDVSYLDLCQKGECDAILFAGDIDHPHPEVKSQLEATTRLHSFTEMRSGSDTLNSDPLNLGLHGGVSLDGNLRDVVFGQITVTVAPDGEIDVQSTKAFNLST